MEKLVAALWKPEGVSREDYNARLLATLPAALGNAGASKVRINVRDAAVDPAEGLRQQWQNPQQDAVVQFWMPSANRRFRGAVDAALASAGARYALWLVVESTIIANTAHPARSGERTWGWSQATFFAFHPDRTREECLDLWRHVHTPIGIETQSNFEYIHNVVVSPLTPDAPAYDAFVEECFPAEAMTDQRAFYDAGEDEAKYQANLAAMMDSCTKFIDFARIDVIPTSQYDFSGEDA